MNLISCDNCGVVLDAGKLKFPEDIWDEDFSVDKAVWDGDNFVPRVTLPSLRQRYHQAEHLSRRIL